MGAVGSKAFEAVSTVTGTGDKPAQVQSLDKVIYPNTKIADNLSNASKLLQEYGKNDLFELQEKYKNPEADAVVKQFQEYVTSSSMTLADFKNKAILDAKMKNMFPALKFVEDKHMAALENQILNTPFMKTIVTPAEQEKVKEIINSVKIIKAREQFFKYEYLFTQIWLVEYIKRMNAAVTEFSEKTLEMYKKNEENRNNYVKEMFRVLLNLIAAEENSISEAQFNLFEKAMVSFENNLTQKGEEFKKQLQSAQDSLVGAVSTPVAQPTAAVPGAAVPTSGGRKLKRKGKKGQKGGFVRDFSRFPQSFYELEGNSA